MLGFRAAVHDDHISVKMFGRNEQKIPLNQIASAQVDLAGSVTIETTGGKRIQIPMKMGEKAKFRDAVWAAQKNNTQTDHSFSVADEIQKLAALKEQGILTVDEFENKKRQLLNL